MFTFIQVILMLCICFKISQGKIILWIHFTKSTISRYDSTFSPQHSRPTLWSIYYLGLQGGRICLSCNGVVKPRDCSTVVVCGTHEVSTNNFSFQFFLFFLLWKLIKNLSKCWYNIFICLQWLTFPALWARTGCVERRDYHIQCRLSLFSCEFMNIHKIDIPIILCTDSFQILIFNISKFESILLYLYHI